MKGMLGAGILSMPNSFSKSGLWLGVISLPVLTAIVIAAMYLLLQTKREANKKVYGEYHKGPVITYMDVGRSTHRLGGWVVLVSICSMQLCFCTGWVIVMSNNLHGMVPSINYRIEILWIFPLLVLLSWIPFIKQLVYTSFFGLLVYLFGVMGVSYYYGIPAIPDNYSHTVKFNFVTLPIFLSNLLYALGGFSGLVGCESTLKRSQQAPAMMVTGMGVYSVGVLLFGSLLYAGGLGGCGVVLDCLPDEWPVLVVKCALTLALLLTHPLGLSYAVEMIEDVLFSPSTNRVVRCLVRSVLVAVTCIVAALVPDFSVFSSFVGSVLLPFCGFILPAFLYFSITGTRPPFERGLLAVLRSKRTWVTIALLGLILFGCVFLVIGLYTALMEQL
eukprot:TRINITY_DN2876_c0_g1_i3.p1 TRINITY_DN2876_c0_g1~~TRINITY_DN2876_c0_g1_i3.p1  ORF type:complete len:388 (+),score=89.16 TRINITY_DN2876_c0_g1_i3:528-1691(+)